MVQVTLTGSNDSSILGNDADNLLRGNGGDNTIDGGDGVDTAIYCADRSAYTVEEEGSHWLVQGPDGTDTLMNIEKVYFSDGVLNLVD